MRSSFVLVYRPNGRIRDEEDIQSALRELRKVPGKVSIVRPHDGVAVVWLDADNTSGSCLSSNSRSEGPPFRLLITQGSDATKASLEQGFVELGRGRSSWNEGWVLIEVDSHGVRVATDPAGEASVHWSRDEETLVVGSQVRHVLAHPNVARDPADEVIFDRLMGLGNGGDRTLFRSITSLLPGHVLQSHRTRGTHVRQWWTWPVPQNTAGLSPQEIYTAVQAAVGRSLDGGRLGVLLSGGLDSSILAGLAAKQGGDVTALTIRYPGLPCDESEYQDAVLTHTQLPELSVSHRPFDLLNDFVEPIERFKLPLTRVEPETIDILRTASSCGVHTVLNGVGGDEIFAQDQLDVVELARNHDATWLWSGSRDRLKDLARTVLPRRALAQLYQHRMPAFIGQDFAQELKIGTRRVPQSRGLGDEAAVRRRLYETFASSQAQIGRETRCMTEEMTGVEFRRPFLDLLVVGRMCGVSNRSLAGQDDSRAYQRTTFASMLPAAIRDRRGKVHFDYRHAIDLASPEIDHLLCDMVLEDRGFVISQELRDMRKELLVRAERDLASIPPLATPIWRALGLEQWLRSVVE